MKTDISIIIPIKNEAESLPALFESLEEVLSTTQKHYEIITINDGSSDNTGNVLKAHADRNNNIRVINFQRNFGQTAALAAGIEHARGEVVIPIDADLENDPHDIPRLLAKMEEGFDVVSGWRKNRWEGKWLTRKLPSTLANGLISKMTGVKLHDYGCTLKAYKGDIISGVKLYGEMHRFIPAYAAWHGGKVAELEVSYAPRKHGKSNYGITRTYRVLLDLVVLKFLTKYMNRPMHFFGGIGFASLAIGFLTGLLAVIFKIIGFRDFVATPLPEFTALFVIVGVQLVVMGVLAEMIMRTYYESQDRRSYVIKEKINF